MSLFPFPLILPSGFRLVYCYCICRRRSSNLFVMIILVILIIFWSILIKLVDFSIKLIPIWIKLVEAFFVVAKEIYCKCWKQHSPECTPVRYFVHNCVVNHFVLENILLMWRKWKKKELSDLLRFFLGGKGGGRGEFMLWITSSRRAHTWNAY